MIRRAAQLLTLTVLLTTGCSISGTPKSTDGGPTATTPVPTVLILDASSSMTQADAPGPRIDAAKSAARELLDALPDKTVVAVETYGTSTGSADSDKSAGCGDVSVLLPLGQHDHASRRGAVDRITPSGYTPISLALRTAAEQLPSDGSQQAIVLLSDGEDTCDTPPCETAAQLKREHSGLTISTVGFKVDGPAASQLRCIAEATGGLFVQAANADQLTSRVLATRDIDQANRSLSTTGILGVDLGSTISDISNTHSDFPEVATDGSVTVVWHDCEFTFRDGVLDSIRSHHGGRTIDGIVVGSPISTAARVYGSPLSVTPAAGDTATVIFDAGADLDTAYRFDVTNYADSDGTLAGTITSITLCRCKPMPVTTVDAELFRSSSGGTIGYFFTTPDLKWRCAINVYGQTSSEAGCNSDSDDLAIANAPLVPSHYDHSPVRPNAIAVDKESARFASHGDPHFWKFDGAARVLGYGQTLAADGYTCNVQRSGISCRYDATRDGFTFSSSGFTFAFTPVTTESTSPVQEAVLGSSDQGASASGYGTSRPSVVSLGNCASSIHDIKWDDWGGTTAHGSGKGCLQSGTSPTFVLVASDLGMCHGVLAYRTLVIGSDTPRAICDS